MRAALEEVLAIIIITQPVTRAEIENIRGVSRYAERADGGEMAKLPRFEELKMPSCCDRILYNFGVLLPMMGDELRKDQDPSLQLDLEELGFP